MLALVGIQNPVPKAIVVVVAEVCYMMYDHRESRDCLSQGKYLERVLVQANN